MQKQEAGAEQLSRFEQGKKEKPASEAYTMRSLAAGKPRPSSSQLPGLIAFDYNQAYGFSSFNNFQSKT